MVNLKTTAINSIERAVQVPFFRNSTTIMKNKIVFPPDLTLMAILCPMFIKLGISPLHGHNRAQGNVPKHDVWVLPSKETLGKLCCLVITSQLFVNLREHSINHSRFIDLMFQYKGKEGSNGPIARFIWIQR